MLDNRLPCAMILGLPVRREGLTMAEIIVRGLDDFTVGRLEDRARKEGRTLQAEAKAVLEHSVKMDMASAWKLVDSIREELKGRKMANSVDLIREDRDR